MKPEFLAYAAASLLALAAPAIAAPPNLQTPAPVIYLADNLDEKDQLGWCIDTLGRGFGERLQAHSCKPQGGDVQFSFDAESGLIQSAEFPDFCMAHSPNDQTTFALVSCDVAAADQRFGYDAASKTIHPSADQSSCVSVAASSRSAGPFMSRSLALTECASSDAALKEWVILE